MVHVTLFFGHCESLTMENVTVKNTRGFGLVGVNVIGTSLLQNVVFVNNTNPGVCSTSPFAITPNFREAIAYDSANQLGGAAVFMYFDYHNQITYQESQFMLSLQECTFTLNKECSLIYFSLLRLPGRGESRFLTNAGYRLGGSGAFALALAQLQYRIDVNVASSSFHNNSASYGGGVLLALFEGVGGVILEICFISSSLSTKLK